MCCHSQYSGCPVRLLLATNNTRQSSNPEQRRGPWIDILHTTLCMNQAKRVKKVNQLRLRQTYHAGALHNAENYACILSNHRHLASLTVTNQLAIASVTMPRTLAIFCYLRLHNQIA